MTVIQQTPLFFFDTANISEIEYIWNKLGKVLPASAIAGITTNPKALDNATCKTLTEFEMLTYRLTRFLTQIRGDSLGAVHVQIPDTSASEPEYVRWASYIRGLGDGRSHVAMKIPPYKNVLEIVQRNKLNNIVQINVTGVADAATALRCFTYPEVTYVSIIPGRMEQAGLDAQKHLEFVHSRNNAFTGNQYVIAGSMRTVDGVKRAIKAGCIPTIGTSVLHLMNSDEYREEIPSWWSELNTEAPVNYFENIPITDDRNIKLTTDFFTQMNEFGQPLYDEFIKVTV